MKKNIFRIALHLGLSVLISAVLTFVTPGADLWTFVDLCTYGLITMGIFLVSSDVIDKILFFPELLSWEYAGGVALECMSVGLFYAASVSRTVWWTYLALGLCVSSLVSVYFYDKHVYNIVILDQKNRRRELETMRLTRFLKGAGKLSVEGITDALKKWNRFYFVNNDMAAGFDFTRELDPENLATWNEMRENGYADDLLTEIENYYGRVASAFLDNIRKEN